MTSDPLSISEIFFSIQGESSRIGRPCTFVRLSFCNLRCSWCDSAYTFTGGTERTVEEVLAEVRGHPTRLVEITGGEPLLQEPVFPLMTRLCDEGFEVLLETSGSIDISKVDQRVCRIVDVKCPGSGMAERNRWKNLDELRPTDELKFVVADRQDYEWARDCIRNRKLDQRCPVLMAPVFDQIDNLSLAQWILADGLPVRFQLQLHKYIWHPQARGV